MARSKGSLPTRASRINAFGDSGRNNIECYLCGEIPPRNAYLGCMVIQFAHGVFYKDFEKYIKRRDAAKNRWNVKLKVGHEREMRLIPQVCVKCLRRLADVVDRALEQREKEQ